eukprot:TRINITY_DN8397_c0_g1_i1.p1 TRINITY_DN8397_c0_g1~~TRINITY_DN8397_c0_g1_i1.p1  ORF type:complete len:240 (-),score=33.54 TRINITY_DN8397_c0_g1_i1:84-803(-)
MCIRDRYKYWLQRYRYFSRYDDGILLDDESWYSVTPEALAHHAAARISCGILLDAFCGCGGNAIQFSFTSSQVIAGDIDPVKVSMAQHNARIYAAPPIEFITADFVTLMNSSIIADVVFLAPPWGGPAYRDRDEFFLTDIAIREASGGVGQGKLYDGFELFKAVSRKITQNVVFLLPRHTAESDLIKLAQWNYDEWRRAGSDPATVATSRCEFEECYFNNVLKAIMVYFGELANPELFS